MIDIKFKVDEKEYCAHLSSGYVMLENKQRRSCTCTLTTGDPIRVFSGVAIKNPNDNMKYDENQGFHLAFKRAIFQMFLITEIVAKIEITKVRLQRSVVKSWVAYWHKYRVPFGKALHSWYEDNISCTF